MITIRHALTLLLATTALTAACRSGDGDGDHEASAVSTATYEPSARVAAGSPDHAALVARGASLVAHGLCDDCHTPVAMGPKGPQPDLLRRLSGHPESVVMPPAPVLPANGPWMATAGATMTAWSGPWGTSFTANLTPDPETGLGAWTAQDFIAAIRTGRHMGKGRPILPPMPVAPINAAYTDEELTAMFAFLRTLPPIVNHVPQPIEPASAPPADRHASLE